jgi:hypothetical protein
MTDPKPTWLRFMYEPVPETDDALMHAYDPVKAREYYLRTRKLKGRDPAQPDAAYAFEANKAEESSNKKAVDSDKKIIAKQDKRLKESRERRAALKKQLGELRGVLGTIGKEAKKKPKGERAQLEAQIKDAKARIVQARKNLDKRLERERRKAQRKKSAKPAASLAGARNRKGSSK